MHVSVRPSRGLSLLTALLTTAALLGGLLTSARPARAASPNLVISQVYGGGGNASAPFTHDFIELFNLSSSPVSLAGLSLQYSSATGTGNLGATSAQLTELPSVTLQPSQHFLVQQASNAAVGSPLPTPDYIDPSPIALSATGGKVALVSGVTALGCNGGSTLCTPEQLARIIDLVGYGSANFSEGSPTATPSNTTAVLRASAGCTDSDNNSADFSVGAPTPRNTAAPLTPCGTPAVTTVSVVASDPDASESGPDTGSFTISRNGDTAAALTVSYSVGGSAGAGDYTPALSGSATIDAGQSATSITITPIDDAAIEGAETVVLSILDGADYDLGSPGVATLTIADNDAAPPVACSEPDTLISTIQGSGLSAALTGPQTVQGVVTGIFPGLSSITVQEETSDEDGNPATSEGILVFLSSGFASKTAGIAVGDIVQVSGTVQDRSTTPGPTLQTQITSSSGVSGTPIVTDCNLAPATIVPVEISFPLASIDALEPYESMLVSLPQTLSIVESFNYDRFGELVLGYADDIAALEGRDRFYTPTSIVEPGAEAVALAAAYELRQLTLDDASSSQNPPTLRHPNGEPFSLSNRFRAGDTVTGQLGVIENTFGIYRIQPTAPAQFAALNVRPAAPEEVGGRLQIGAFNTLNYFLTIDTTVSDSGAGPCGGNQNLDCRGADDQGEFARQRAKLLQAIIGLDADALGLIELENTPGVEPLADIVAGLNAILGADTYTYIDTGVIGTDAIKVGIIYRPAALAPVGDYATLTRAVDPRFIDTRNRPSLAQTFEEVATGARFTLVVNHLKSKGSGCGAGDDDTTSGQGNCNGTRTQAAAALVDWLASDPTASGDPDFLVVGDLNAYAKEAPIDAIVAGPDDSAGTSDDYTNLIAAFQGRFAYSYLFDGQLGYLDHALSSATLTSQVTGATEWHINADEPDILDYDTSFKPNEQDALYEPNPYRTADHDPVLVGLSLDIPNAAPVAADDSAQTTYTVPVTIDVLANDSDAEGDALSVSIVAPPASGSAVVNPNGTITFTPGAQATGSAVTSSFVYQVSDGNGGTAQATVRVESVRLQLTAVCPVGMFHVRNPGSFPIAYSWDLYQMKYAGTGIAQPGDSFFSIGRDKGTVRLFVNGVQHDLKAPIDKRQCK